MKKANYTILTFVIVIACSFTALSQNCIVEPLGWEQVIGADTIMTIAGNGEDSIVICAGSTVTYNLPNNNLFVYIESNAELVLQAWDGAVIRMNPNATLTIDTTASGYSGAYIFIEYEIGTSNLVDTSHLLNAFYKPCSSISFSYFNFPNGVSPCAQTAVADKDNSDHSISMFPNPSNGKITVHAMKPGAYTVTDLTGRQVAIGTINTELDLSNQPAGIYLVNVNNRTMKLALR